MAGSISTSPAMARTRCTGTAAAGPFANVTQSAGVGSAHLSTSCAFADIDRDGDLDLFVANYVDLDRRKTSSAATIPDVRALLPSADVYRGSAEHPLSQQRQRHLYRCQHGRQALYATAGNGLGVVFADYDDDGWPDVFVANDPVPNFLYHNEGSRDFREVGLLAGVAVASDGESPSRHGHRLRRLRRRRAPRSRGDELRVGVAQRCSGILAAGCLRTRRPRAASDVADAAVPRLRRGLPRLRQRRRPRSGDRQRPRAGQSPSQFRANSSHAQRNLLLRNDGGRLRKSDASPAPASRSKKSVGRWRLAISTTTAIWICW